MGIYCFQCGCKVLGAVAPVTCRCFWPENGEKIMDSPLVGNFLTSVFGYAPTKNYYEGFCQSCWLKFFATRHVPVTTPLFVKSQSGKFIKYSRKLAVELHGRPLCPLCSVQFEKTRYNSFEDLFDEEEE